MIVTKKALSRRTVLRGMGATIALPYLDAMVPAARRFGATAALPRSLLHRAGNVLLDLHFESAGRTRFWLTGQVTDAAAERAMAGSGILLVHGTGELVAQSIANSLGEFQLDYEHESPLRLYVETPDSTVIAADLPEPGSPPD